MEWPTATGSRVERASSTHLDAANDEAANMGTSESLESQHRHRPTRHRGRQEIKSAFANLCVYCTLAQFMASCMAGTTHIRNKLI
uniref:Uncharacterized protein n=1 Tax=Steinernema glaseri TaxID=37863 RepID=A0A1I7Y2Z7_9BILA